CDRLYVLVDSRSLPDWPWHRQQFRLDAGAERQAAETRAGMVPNWTVRGDGLDGVGEHAVAAVLAREPVDYDQRVVSVSARFRPLSFCGSPRRTSLGREFSAGARVGRVERRRPREAGGWRVRGEHVWRHPRLAPCEPRSDRPVWHAAF